MGDTPMFGVPGLETAVGLLFKAVHDKRLRVDDVVNLLHHNPRKIFNIPVNDETFVELDPQLPYQSGKNGYESKSGWSPFAQWELYGAVETVVINGKPIVKQQKIVRGGTHMAKEAFYAADRSYEENYDNGPFGLFRDLPAEIRSPMTSEYFLGHKVDLPFGIPAGPLLNSRFVVASWVWGFPIVTYKTVRGNEYPCHPAPNIIKVTSETQNITPGQTVIGDFNTQDIDVTRDGITNSFGVPSKSPDIWQADVRDALKYMNTGNVLILSFMGTKREGMNFDEYVADFVSTAKLAKETGAPILEVNFSCPNVGKEGLICNDYYTSASILEALKSVRGNIPLLVKIGYFPKEQNEELKKLLGVIYEYADGVAAINTIQATVVDRQGGQILPGSPVRIQSGICGAAIRWAGLEMAERITHIKEQQGWEDLTVIGVGGVVTPEDYFKYLSVGVDAVQSATGAMWRPTLAQEIRAQLNTHYEVPSSTL
jgi:dihydroorotate dehydrogenase